MHAFKDRHYGKLWEERSLLSGAKIDDHKNISLYLWKRTETMQNRYSLFCHALLLTLKRCEMVCENIPSAADACLAISASIIHHVSHHIEYEASGSMLPEIDMVMKLFSGKVYFPTAIDIFDAFNCVYKVVDEEVAQIGRLVVACAYGSEIILALSLNEIAISAFVLAQLFSCITDYKPVPSHPESVKNVDILHKCVVTSPLFHFLPDKVKVSVYEFIPSSEIFMEELIHRTTSSRAETIIPAKANSVNTKKAPKTTIKIGSGVCSTVTKVKSSSGKMVAQKKQNEIEMFVKEISLMCAMDHKNVQGIINFDVYNLSFTMDIQSSTLKNEIENGTLTQDTYRKYVKELFDGLTYIHSLCVMHGDLKPSNILVTDNGTLKIADFGHSIGHMVGKRTMSSTYVAKMYRAYELLLQKDKTEYGIEIDIWSCGMIILEMNKGGEFICDLLRNNCKLLDSMLDNHMEDVTKDMEADIALVVKQCFAPPKHRATAAQCKALIC